MDDTQKQKKWFGIVSLVISVCVTLILIAIAYTYSWGTSGSGFFFRFCDIIVTIFSFGYDRGDKIIPKMVAFGVSYILLIGSLIIALIGKKKNKGLEIKVAYYLAIAGLICTIILILIPIILGVIFLIVASTQGLGFY